MFAVGAQTSGRAASLPKHMVASLAAGGAAEARVDHVSLTVGGLMSTGAPATTPRTRQGFFFFFVST